MRLKVSNVCQLYDKTYLATQTVNGVTFTNNGDGSVTVNGTASNTATAEGEFLRVNPGDIILMFSGYDIAGLKTAYVYCSQWDENKKWIADLGYPSLLGRISTCVKNCRYIRYTYRVDTGNTAANAVIKLQMFNLTEMYGAGNEPTTVAQFRQDFPNEMYEYSPVCWKKFRRLKYIANKEPVQLLDKSKFEAATSKNVTATPDTTNGMWTISGAATASEYLQIGVYYPGTDFDIGDKLFLRHSNADNLVYFPYAAWYDKDNKYLGEYDGTGIFSVTNSKIAYIACYFVTRKVGDINVTTQVQLFNLTRMYGKGNEPTAAEFAAQYPGLDYPVNKYSYLTLNRGKYIANKEPVQLLDKSKYRGTVTREGITFTNNGDGTWTVVGTAPDDPINHAYVEHAVLIFDKVFTQKHFIPGHKIIIGGGEVKNVARVQWILSWLGGYIASSSIDTSPYEVKEYPENFNGNNISIRVQKGQTVNFTFKPQLFDLTAMYGEGNEPTTVEQFRADFPNELYDYNPYNAITFR